MTIGYSASSVYGEKGGDVITVKKVDVWLYGPLAKYGGDQSKGAFAHLQVELPTGARMKDLLEVLKLPLDEKGITFINAALSDMPGLSADLECALEDGDRVGIFSSTHMWPYQYRGGARTTPELEKVLRERDEGALHHSYRDYPSQK
jgi:hypothetical protein